ncbi:MAG: fused MFS/spermidine synthase [Candidatus Nitrosotenuis sp.]
MKSNHIAVKFWHLAVLVFVCGAAVMALEIVSSRILTPVFGSTTYTWGSLIGVILTGLSLGYFYGGRIADKNPTMFKFSSIIFSAGLYVVFIPYVAPLIMELYDPISLNSLRVLLSTFTLLTIPSFLLGMISPYSVKLGATALSRVGSVTGNLYFLSTAGSIAGTFLAVFGFIPFFEVNQIIFSLGVSLLLVSLVGLSRFPKLLVVFVGILVFLPTSVVGGVISHSGTLVYEKETPYSHLDVIDSKQMRTMYLNSMLHSRMSLNQPDELVVEYTKYFYLGEIFNPNFQKVLFVGGGGFSGPKNFLANYPNAEIDVVEIDPDIISAAKTYFNVNENPKLRIFNEDARIFLANTDEKYDVIVLDAFSKYYVPFHLMTLEYFELLKNRLEPDGVVISNLIGTTEGDTSTLVRSVYKTMNQVFPTIYVFKTKGYDSVSVQNIMFVTSRSNIDFGSAFERNTDVAYRNKFLENYVGSQMKVDDVYVLTDQFAPVEHLINPVTNKPLEIDEKETVAKSSTTITTSTYVTISLLLSIVIVWFTYVNYKLNKSEKLQIKKDFQ